MPRVIEWGRGLSLSNLWATVTPSPPLPSQVVAFSESLGPPSASSSLLMSTSSVDEVLLDVLEGGDPHRVPPLPPALPIPPRLQQASSLPVQSSTGSRSSSVLQTVRQSVS